MPMQIVLSVSLEVIATLAGKLAFIVVVIDESATTAVHPPSVYLIVTVLSPVVRHFKVTVESVAVIPPDVIV